MWGTWSAASRWTKTSVVRQWPCSSSAQTSDFVRENRSGKSIDSFAECPSARRSDQCVGCRSWSSSKDPRFSSLRSFFRVIQVQEAIARTVVGRTVLIIAHRLSTIRHADKILVLQNGRIVEDGNHVTLINQRGLYYQLVKRQTEHYQTEKKLSADAPLTEC